MAENDSPIRRARELRGLTQEALAGMVGVTKQAVSAWETGESVASGPARRILAGIFMVPLEQVDSWFSASREAA